MKVFFAFLLAMGAASAQYAPRYYKPAVPAPLANDGRVIDTPEVAHLKSAHFAAHDAAKRAAPHPPAARYQEYAPPQQRYDEGPAPRYDDYSEPQQEQPRWRGPFAKIEFTQDGKFIKETPEVAHARQQHLDALGQERQRQSHVGYEGEARDATGHDGQYHGEGEREGQYDPALYENQQRQQQQQHQDNRYRVHEGAGEPRPQYYQGQPNQYRPNQYQPY